MTSGSGAVVDVTSLSLFRDNGIAWVQVRRDQSHTTICPSCNNETYSEVSLFYDHFANVHYCPFGWPAGLPDLMYVYKSMMYVMMYVKKIADVCLIYVWCMSDQRITFSYFKISNLCHWFSQRSELAWAQIKKTDVRGDRDLSIPPGFSSWFWL